MGTKLVDFLLSIKDFVVGSVTGVANGPYSWASWVWPLTTIAGIGVGLATGNAALALGILAGGPLLAGAAGAVVGLLTGGVSEVVHNQSERSRNRAADERTRVPAPIKPAKTASLEVPTTEITQPSVPIRLADTGQNLGRG